MVLVVPMGMVDPFIAADMVETPELVSMAMVSPIVETVILPIHLSMVGKVANGQTAGMMEMMVAL